MSTLKILRLEERWIAVDKPSGLLSVPGRGPEKADCVVARAAVEFGWIREVHRLDEATSGVMILARDAESHRRFCSLFAERKTRKTYVAICAALSSEGGKDCRDQVIPLGDAGHGGHAFSRSAVSSGGAKIRDGKLFPSAAALGDSGRIVLFQRLDPENRPRQVVDFERGKEAVTHWCVLETAEDRVRLELRPLTGRTHQLRLACARMGVPIFGDALYAPPDVAAAAERLMLHASLIGFPDPFGGNWITVESPLPF